MSKRENIQMDQIKLLRVTNQKQPDLQKSYEFEEVVTNQIKKSKLSLEELEPWNQDNDRNPFISIKSERIKKEPSPRIKKQGSLSTTKNQIWKSPQKVPVQRQSKILPVMDVGELNKIRRSLYPGKTISRLDLNSPAVALAKIRSRKEITLPSVTRQLSIQRKIFLMKSVSSQQNQASPLKSSRIRSIIQEGKK